jgi:hypothetical protein
MTNKNLLTAHNLSVGNLVLFDHFGGKNRQGRVVKLTPTAVHIEWVSPSSGIKRVVSISLKVYFSNPDEPHSQFTYKNIRLMPASLMPYPESVASHLRVDVADLEKRS